MIKPFDGFTQPKNMKLDHASMWIQLHNLPLIRMNISCEKKIRDSIGVVEKVDGGDDVVG